MRFAVVGDSPSVAGFVRAIARSPEHELATFVDAPRLRSTLLQETPTARVVRDWQEVLSDPQIDAVVVAADGQPTLEAARQLAAAGKSLFVGPTAGMAANFAYELTLLESEQNVVLVPLFGLRAHPLVARLRKALTDSRFGAIRHVQLERRLTSIESTTVETGLLAPADLAATFLRDADLLRSIWGDFEKLTAVRSGDEARGISRETITLAGSASPQITWTATVSTELPGWRLSVVGQLGTAILSGNAEAGELLLESTVSGETADRAEETLDPNEWLLGEAASAISASSPQRTPREPLAVHASYPDWGDFTKAVELLDAGRRSLRRNRTIELHFEIPSERGQFKTQMTAVGCSLLMFVLAAVVAYLTLTSLVEINERLKQVLVALIFLPLGIFLALQALLFLARPSASESRHHPSGSDSPAS